MTISFFKRGMLFVLNFINGGLFEAILVLHQQHGYVRCVDVADYLGVSKSSVSRAVKELTKSGHIIKKDGTLYLTQQGRQYAEQICERYLFFTARLVDAGVDRKTAEHDACNIEHAISAEAFQKLKNSLTNK